MCTGATVDFDPGPGIYNMTSAGIADIFVLKLDNTGNFIFARSMGGLENDFVADMSIDANQNVYITGDFRSTADFDPGPGVYTLTSVGFPNSSDIFVLKLDSNGDFLWAKKTGSSMSDLVFALVVDNGGNVYTTGAFQYTSDFDPGLGVYNLVSQGGDYDIFIWKLDAGGNFVWAKRIGGNAYDCAEAIALDAAGNVYTTGFYGDTVDFDPGPGYYPLMNTAGGLSMFVARLNPNGDFLSAVGMGDYTNAGGKAICISNTNDIYIAGSYVHTVDVDPGPGVYNLTQSGDGAAICLLKLDFNLNFVWAESLKRGWPRELKVDNAENIYLTGAYEDTLDVDPGVGIYNILPFGGIYDIFTVKYHYCGNTYNVTYDACDSITLFGNTYTASGYYIHTFADVNGCDSNLNMHIILHSDTTIYTQMVVCDSVDFGGNMITASGTYTHVFSGIGGCDSTVIADIVINHSTDFSITQMACDSFTLNGQIYTASGVYTQTMINANGCDSIITLNLSINNSSFNITDTACGTYTLNGQTYTSSGIYTQVLPNANGCDSTITLNLTVHTLPIVNIFPFTDSAICIGTSYVLYADSNFVFYNWTLNGNVVSIGDSLIVNAGGTYIFTCTDTNGCSVSDTAIINMIPAPQPIIVQNNNELTCTNVDSVNYQWFLNNNAIGTNDSILTITQDGIYMIVTADSNGCIGVDTLQVLGLDMENITSDDVNIMLYPNPVSQNLFIENEKAFQNACIKILNIAGQTIIEEKNIFNKKVVMNTSQFTSGVYFVEITNNGKKYVRKITRE